MLEPATVRAPRDTSPGARTALLNSVFANTEFRIPKCHRFGGSVGPECSAEHLTTLSNATHFAMRQSVSTYDFIRPDELYREGQSLAVTCSRVDGRLSGGVFSDSYRTGMLPDVKTLDFELTITIESDSFSDAAMRTVIVDGGARFSNL